MNDNSHGDDLFDENEYLKWALDDYRDDSFCWLFSQDMPPEEERRFLEEFRDWDHAPIRKVGAILAGKCVLIDPKTASDDDVFYALEALRAALRARNLHLVYTDHLSDRNLYELIVKKIFAHEIKDFGDQQPATYWDFCSYEEDESHRLRPSDVDDVFLSYFATDEERYEWAQYNDRPLPAKRAVRYHRDDSEEQAKLCFH
ncbi:MAG: hypothetical protein IJU03_07135 [Thermoguttaceae bacterium]|nr:hypothetical protein [Thermoguttaceae bacterium]